MSNPRPRQVIGEGAFAGATRSWEKAIHCACIGLLALRVRAMSGLPWGGVGGGRGSLQALPCEDRG